MYLMRRTDGLMVSDDRWWQIRLTEQLKERKQYWRSFNVGIFSLREHKIKYNQGGGQLPPPHIKKKKKIYIYIYRYRVCMVEERMKGARK